MRCYQRNYRKTANLLIYKHLWVSGDHREHREHIMTMALFVTQFRLRVGTSHFFVVMFDGSFVNQAVIFLLSAR